MAQNTVRIPERTEFSTYSQTLLYRVVPLLCNDRKREHALLGNAGKHVNDIRAVARQPPTETIEGLLEAVFSVGSALRLCSEDPRPAEGSSAE
jgi:hypothetical protein